MASLTKGLSSGVIIGLGVAIYVLTAILPGAMDNIFGVNTTGWDAGTAALWTLLPLVLVALFITRFAPGGKGE